MLTSLKTYRFTLLLILFAFGLYYGWRSDWQFDMWWLFRMTYTVVGIILGLMIATWFYRRRDSKN